MTHHPNALPDTDDDDDFEAMLADPEDRALLSALARAGTPVRILCLKHSSTRGPRSRELRDLGLW